MLSKALDLAQAAHQADLEEWFEELRIPSVGTTPEGRPDTIRNANWLADRFRAAGLEARLWGDHYGMPVVHAEWMGRPGAPLITIYGHYDVQPPDPLDLWTTPPFEPTVRDGRVYARGAADSKGNHFPALKAAQHAIAAGGPPVNLRFLIEGEEESGGIVLPRYLAEHGADLATDCVLIWDGGTDFDGSPVLCTGLRGILYTEIHARGAQADLHSGEYGGAAPNPINTLARVIAGLKDAEGRITIPGFYDGVQRASQEELEEWAALPNLEKVFGAQIGVPLEGEPGWSLAERLQTRPTLDCNGIWGGFMEKGEKTVIPAEAHAKVSMRLVPDQDADRIFERLVQYVPGLSTPGVGIAVEKLSSAPPVVLGVDHRGAKAAASALQAAFGKPARQIRSGGSIPVTVDFQRHVGAPMVCSGFSQFDCAVHSPNENYLVENFAKGVEMMLRFFWGYGEQR